MPSQNDFLFEIGTEELPPKALNKLSANLSENIKDYLTKHKLDFAEIKNYATPRRLAVLITNLISEKPSEEIIKKGPNLKAAFDSEGKPTKACEGFAKSCGTTPDKLEKQETDKGVWLIYREQKPAQPIQQLLPEIINQAIKKLPIPKNMRWGNYTTEFVRPVHWIVLLYGSEVINTELLGKQASNITYGHRFLHPDPIQIKKPSDYEKSLETQGKTICDFSKRKDLIKTQCEKIQDKFNGKIIIDNNLLDEVTALVEWPVALLVSFDKKFLSVPKEALVSAMMGHQKCFYCEDNNGKLLPHFITISNLISKNPEQVIDGNRRVMTARLSDAEFFYNTDKNKSLTRLAESLQPIVFQKQLGTMADKVERITELTQNLAKTLQLDIRQAVRAAKLCKADLCSDMVGEFPELQGIMGKYYAFADSEEADVSAAIEQHYWPRFAKDDLPQSPLASVLAIADRLDNLIGLFGINQPPTGDKDPFGLRRGALGIIKIILENKISLSLNNFIALSINLYDSKLINKNTAQDVLNYIFDRLKSYYLDQGVLIDEFNAVMANGPDDLLDFDARIKAIQYFKTLPESNSLAIANKRVSNILKKQAQDFTSSVINPTLFENDFEKILFNQINQKSDLITPLYNQKNYKNILSILAELREPIDNFFDNTMVMCDDEQKKQNRLALLFNLRKLFIQIADISLLQQKEDQTA